MARKFTTNWAEIDKKIKESENGGGKIEDKRIYTLKPKENGSANAIIRFLPQKDLSKVPFVKVFNHGFKHNGKWFIHNCPTTIGKQCPVCKSNTELWSEDEDTVRERSRKTSYYANIYVIKDPQKPENEGKVFIYRFGKKIFEKIMSAWKPQEGSIDEPIQVFDYYEGANFKLIVTSTSKGSNYDQSKFSETVTELVDGNDEELEKINAASYDLDDFVSPDKFESYEELENRFNDVIGKNVFTQNKKSKEESVENESVSEDNVDEKENKSEEKKTIKIEDDKNAFLAKLKKSIK